MISVMEAPKRKYTANLKLSGDTWEDIVHELNFLHREIIEHGEICSSVSGGVSTGRTVDIVVDPLMTHEKYIEELNKYLEWLRIRDQKQVAEINNPATCPNCGGPDWHHTVECYLGRNE